MKPSEVNHNALNEQSVAETAANLAWNAASNWPRISEEAMTGKPVCVTQLPGASGVPAVIIGSGPSLDEAAPNLTKFPGAIFCGPSQVRILDRWNRLPDYIVAIDTSPVVAEQLAGPLYSRTILLTHQAIDPSVLEVWKWKKRFVRLDIGDSYQEAVYPWLRMRFTAHGCTVNAALQLALFLGYSPIFLVGVDFGYPEGKLRATDYRPRGTHAYIEVPPREAMPDKDTDTYTGLLRENGVLTTREQYFYKLGFLQVWAASQARIWSCSRGILSEVPWVQYDEIIESDYDMTRYPLRPDEITALAGGILEPFGIRVTPPDTVEKADALVIRRSEILDELTMIDDALMPWERSDDGTWKYSPSL